MAVLTSMTALVGGIESPLPMLWAMGLWGIGAVLVLASAFAVGTVMAGWRFISAVSLRPQGGLPDMPSEESFVDELWRLAAIAVVAAKTKHRLIRRGIPWLCLAAVSAFLWSLLSALS